MTSIHDQSIALVGDITNKRYLTTKNVCFPKGVQILLTVPRPRFTVQADLDMRFSAQGDRQCSASSTLHGKWNRFPTL